MPHPHRLNAIHHEKAKRVVATVLWISLILSILYAAVRVVAAPSSPTDEEGVRLKSDYVLILIQCLLGLVVMTLPTFIEKRWRIVLPDTIVILYFIFLYCAIFLGEVFSFYYRIPHWDSMLHAFSGAMLGALGFVLVDFLNKDSHVKVSLAPFFISLFAFSFALSVGALWEVYEFSFDYLLGLNMQKHTTSNGIGLVGREALSDTMKDIIIDAAAALFISALGYVLNKRKQLKEIKENAVA